MVDELVLLRRGGVHQRHPPQRLRDGHRDLAEFAGERLQADRQRPGPGLRRRSFDAERLPDPDADHGRGLFIIAALMDSLELRVEGGLRCRWCAAWPQASVAARGSALGEPPILGAAGPSEARSRALLEEIDEAVVALDWEYRYAYANGRAFALLGRPRGSLSGAASGSCSRTLKRRPWRPSFAGPWSLAGPLSSEHRSRSADSWLEVRIYPTITGVTVFFHDISERKARRGSSGRASWRSPRRRPKSCRCRARSSRLKARSSRYKRELRVQAEELRRQNQELRVQRDALARESELRGACHHRFAAALDP